MQATDIPRLSFQSPNTGETARTHTRERERERESQGARAPELKREGERERGRGGEQQALLTLWRLLDLKKASEAVQCIRSIVDQRLIIDHHELDFGV